MKILYICNEYPPAPYGGIGIYTRRVASVMASNGHKVFVVGYLPFVGRKMDGAVTVIGLEKGGLQFLRGLYWRIKMKRAVEKIVLNENIDVVEVPEYEGWLPFGLKNCNVGLRLHLSATHIYEESKTNISGMLTWFERQTLKRNRFWLPVSQSILDASIKKFNVVPIKSRVLYPFLPELRCASLKEDRIKLPENFVLFASALSERKGAIVSANVFNIVLTKNKKMHAVFIGSGNDSFKNRILENFDIENRDRVHLMGQQSHASLMYAMKSAKIFLFLSRLESFGLVLTEAAILKCPIITADIGCVPEVLVPGEHVLGCTNMNEKTIASLVIKALNSQDRIRKISLAARSRVLHLMDEKVLAREYLNAYSQIKDLK
jgi:glycosyltransferase involved in cell wall biosynthesis